MYLKNAYRPLFTGLGLLFLSGCYAPYGGYPPGAYAPQGGAPMQYQGVPQSSYVMPGDSLGSPSSAGFAPQSTFAPGGTIQAPDPTARDTTRGSTSPVPPPRDPDPSAVKPTSAGQQTSQLGSPSGPPVELDFRSPIVFTGGDDQSAGGVIAASGQSPADSSSGHDPNYNWFQGRLEYVESDQAWHLTYDDAPTAFDQLGGDITLSQDVKLEPQHNGLIVRVSGQFDDRKLDRLKKPVFRVSQIDQVGAQ
jgi:hypothetical protein